MCPKDKLFRGYIDMEIQLREFDRCRILYQKFLEFGPENCITWMKVRLRFTFFLKKKHDNLFIFIFEILRYTLKKCPHPTLSTISTIILQNGALEVKNTIVSYDSVSNKVRVSGRSNYRNSITILSFTMYHHFCCFFLKICL